MPDLFSGFLERPGEETYLPLRAAVLKDPSFDLFSEGLRQLESLIAEGSHAAALDLVPQLMPNYLLSPRAHALISIAATETGAEARATSETRLAQACLIGLTETGSGTEDAPYRPLHVADEADVLSFLGREWVSQRQVRSDGRMCDVILDGTGEECWFDMSDSFAAASKAM